MKIRELIKETATAGATSAGNIATVVNPAFTKKASKKGAKVVSKNALDTKGVSIFGGPAIKR